MTEMFWDILANIERLGCEIKQLDREIQQHRRWTIFWRLFGNVNILLVIVAYLIRVLVIG